MNPPGRQRNVSKGRSELLLCGAYAAAYPCVLAKEGEWWGVSSSHPSLCPTALLRILQLWARYCSCKAMQLLGGMRKWKSLELLAEEPHVTADALGLLSG